MPDDDRRAELSTLQRIAIEMGKRGIDREDKLLLASDHAGRALRSTGELSEPEAQDLLRRLRDLDAHDLASTVRRLRGQP
jgi:hypothetical protein